MGFVIGSNIFNIMCVIGLVSMVTPLPVDRGLLFSFALIPFMKTGYILSRIEGGILLIGYSVFITSLLLV